jgi:hypothetical protein
VDLFVRLAPVTKVLWLWLQVSIHLSKHHTNTSGGILEVLLDFLLVPLVVLAVAHKEKEIAISDLVCRAS